MITVTNQMVRDYLAHKGPNDLEDLVDVMGLNAAYKNRVMAALLDLQYEGMVSYNLATGKWQSDVVIE